MTAVTEPVDAVGSTMQTDGVDSSGVPAGRVGLVRPRIASRRSPTARRVPRWRDLRPYLRAAPFHLSPAERRLAAAATIADLRSAARRVTPRAVFDYVDGAAETETSLRRARDAFARVEFVPRVLRDVSTVDTSTTILGRPAAMPVVFAPTGFTRLMNHEGEPSVGRVAARVGIPYALSTLGTTSPEDLAAAAPDADLWFQLYLWHDRDAGVDLVRRARAAGYRALILTVDTPVAGRRLRDVHNGFTIPPTLSVRTVLDIARHPGWWFDLLTTEPLRFAVFSETHGTVADLIDRVFDPSITVADLGWGRDEWPGPIVVKGIMTPDDARLVVDAGADAVVVSNHGGRQLDRAPTPLEQLPGIVAAVGDRAEVYVDGGVMSGADIVAGVALGARAVLVGRSYLYGLMAGGERGVQRAVDLLRAEMLRTMRLLGVTTVTELGPASVRLRERE
ncbi:MAG TPA: alpha-hydroxy acid oxidase [Candidatus Dormibacteraeota bacterium]|nr:alpha-hydroxy acid oxidase [Candidatus Dormibacteraeota bacterium]